MNKPIKITSSLSDLNTSPKNKQKNVEKKKLEFETNKKNFPTKIKENEIKSKNKKISKKVRIGAPKKQGIKFIQHYKSLNLSLVNEEDNLYMSDLSVEKKEEKPQTLFDFDSFEEDNTLRFCSNESNKISKNSKKLINR